MAQKPNLPPSEALYEVESAARIFPFWFLMREDPAYAVIASERTVNPHFALEAIRGALREDPYSPYLLRWYAEFQFRSGEIEGAERTLSRLMGFAPYSSDVMLLHVKVAAAIQSAKRESPNLNKNEPGGDGERRTEPPHTR